MLDLIAAISNTAVYAVLVGTLVGLAPADAAHKRTLFLVAAAWGGLVVTVAAAGGFAPGATGPIPGPGLTFAGLLALLVAGWFLRPQFRAALLALPFSALLALNIPRLLLGALFLFLAADGRLAGTFASSAGWGDITAGLAAVPLALAARRGHASPAPITLWNIFGTLDLIVALLLGVLSAPNTPLRLLTDEPGTLAIGDLPWIMIPGMVVPIYLLIHLTIATKLRAAQRLAGAAAAAG
jgi:hypothetical protein